MRDEEKDKFEDVDVKELNEKKKQDLKKRLKEYALRIIHLYEALPKHGAVHVITHQLLRSGTSPGAHYEKLVVLNPMQILSAKSKERYKNLKKAIIG